MFLQLSILRIPVRIHVWFLLTCFLLWNMAGESAGTWETLLVTVAVVFQGVLFHELGHALVGRAFGLSPRIELLALGGVTWWEKGEPLTPGKSMLVSVAGPAVGIVLGLPAMFWYALAEPSHPVLSYALLYFTFVNLGWAVFNLTPMLPLDGGNIMAAVFELFAREPIRGRIRARYVSFGVMAALGALFLSQGSLFMGVLLGMFALDNWRGLKADRLALEDGRLKGRRSRPRIEESGEPIPADLEAGFAALERGDADAVIRIGRHILGATEDRDRRDEAWHLLGWGYLLAGDAAEARASLDQMSGERSPDPGLVGAIHLELGRPQAAWSALAEAMRDGHGGDFVEKRLVRATRELGWFERALTFARDLPADRVAAGTLHAVQTDAFYVGRHDTALALGELLHERHPSSLSAYNIACCLARLDRPDEALGWLRRATEMGLADPSVLDTDEDLEPVRALPEWAEFRSGVEPAE